MIPEDQYPPRRRRIEDLFEPPQPPKVEPSAEMRSMAQILRQSFVALVDAGFSEEQALYLVCEQMTIAANQQQDGE